MVKERIKMKENNSINKSIKKNKILRNNFNQRCHTYILLSEEIIKNKNFINIYK